MIKLLMNLKNSFVSVVIIVALLCVQAICDLELPSYTSDIVNIGIQASGIENVTPEAVRKSTMDEILLFSDQDEKILNSYVLFDDLTEGKDEIREKFPKSVDEQIYVLKNEVSKEEISELNEILAKPLLIAQTMSNDEMSQMVKGQIIQGMPEQQQAIISQMELEDILNTMSQETLDKMVGTFNQMIDEKVGPMASQAAIAATKSEYEALGVDMEKYQTDYMLITGAKMLGIAIIIMFSAIIIMLLSSRTAARLAKDLREKVFAKVLKFSTKEFREYSTASLITRSTNDIQQIQNLITFLFRVIIYAPIIGLGGLLKVSTVSDTSMSWIIGLAIGVILLIVGSLFITVMPKFKKVQELIDRLNLVSREILTGLPVIRAFNTEKNEEERFSKSNIDLMKINMFVSRTMSMMMPLLMFIMNSIMILIVWVGGHHIDSGTMRVGDMMAFIQYTMQIVMSFLMISMISIILPRASVSAKRINEIIDTDESIKDEKETKEFDDNKKGLVEFKNVCFKYPDADTEILVNIDFTAKPGETTAIIGSTGSGKSTVVNLIPRFYDVTRGEILIDGVNIKEVKQADLRKRIGFVPQKGMLFSGTIESNIKYGNKDLSDEKMIEAAEIAQAKEFIDSKPEGYKTEIAQGGSNVSGGQRQRLSIARAIAVDPEIFVFDDSFSALDFKTDATLRAALSEKTKDKTVIIVAQRINTILNADQIIVLEEGKIVGKGTHSELLETCDTYKQIALSQLSKEELENGRK